jgi:hypothetical protein
MIRKKRFEWKKKGREKYAKGYLEYKEGNEERMLVGAKNGSDT